MNPRKRKKIRKRHHVLRPQPKAMLQKFRISSLRLSLSGYNLLTFSDLDFCDPESNPDGRAYPLIKVVNFGLKIGF